MPEVDRGLPPDCICAEIAEIVGNHLDDDPIRALCDLHASRLIPVRRLADTLWVEGQRHTANRSYAQGVTSRYAANRLRLALEA